MKPFIELTIGHGFYGEKTKRVALNIPEHFMLELMESVETSNDPFSLMLASPGMYGGHGNAVDIRRKKFALRDDFSRYLADTLVNELRKAFGANDVKDGYSIEQQNRREAALYGRSENGLQDQGDNI
jgi:hypothetical protein